jgi:hypothetical protein
MAHDRDERVSLPLDPETALRGLMKVDPAPAKTPTEVAVEFWGSGEDVSRSAGARRVREIARELFPDEAPGQGGEWELTPDQIAAIRQRI